VGSTQPGYLYAIAAAVLFGASTPAAKWLLNDASPWLLAGLLYLGSGVGLFLVRFVRQRRDPVRSDAPIRGKDWLWLLGATLFGGIIAPVLLMLGLAQSNAGTTSLLLNLEGVFTALLAWFVFKENFDRRIMLGMVAIVGGSVVLSWGSGIIASGASVGDVYMAADRQQAFGGPLLVIGACLGWAIDNNLTKKIASSDALQIAMTKGLGAGITNTTLALTLAPFAFHPGQVVLAGLVGFFGYGISLLCFVLALRHIGAARTGAYFSLAPFVGAGIALAVGETSFSLQLVLASALMGVGVWLHLSERHDHEHVHDPLDHEHRHSHDEHHRHDHSPEDPPGQVHSHRHRHDSLVHAHPHFPDAHHAHSH